MEGNHLFTSEQKLQIWGLGEWVEEIDELKWEYKGIKCQIIRNASMKDGIISGVGQLNGYVVLPRNHPWQEMEYDKIDAKVHGGITDSSVMEDGCTRIGFDCAHYDDETPSTPEKIFRFMMTLAEKSSEEYFKVRAALEKIEELKRLCSLDDCMTYKNINYVKCECERLVDQMLAEKITRDEK